MGARYLLDLADVCRRTGHPVIEVDGWENNARGSGGYDSGYPNHIIVHHTASNASSDGWQDVNYMAYGHPDSPVGNLYLSRDGTVYVMAAGAANTNGTGQDPCGLVPDDSMNSRSLAIEAANNGVGEPWPAVQQDCYRKLCKVLMEAYFINIGQLHAHFEWAPSRKIDPAGQSDYATGSGMWDMDKFRADVLNGTTPPPAPDPEEDDMGALIKIGTNPAVLLVSGPMCSWVKSTAILNELVIAGIAKNPPIVLTEQTLSALTLFGPMPGGFKAEMFAAHYDN